MNISSKALSSQVNIPGTLRFPCRSSFLYGCLRLLRTLREAHFLGTWW